MSISTLITQTGKLRFNHCYIVFHVSLYLHVMRTMMDAVRIHMWEFFKSSFNRQVRKDRQRV